MRMRYYFPAPPQFRLLRQKQDCQKLTLPSPIDLSREAPKSRDDLRREQAVRQAVAKEPPRPHARAHRVLDQIGAVHKRWTTPLASMQPPAPRNAVAAAVAEPQAKPLEPFDLQDVPDTEQANGYKLDPALMRRWFSNPAYAVQSQAQKDCMTGAPFYPATLVDTDTLKLTELMKTVERIRQAVDKIKSREFLDSKPVREALYRVCSRLPAGTVDVDPVKEFEGDLQRMHRRYAFASVTVGKRFLQGFEDIRVHDLDKSRDSADDVALALGEFRLYVAIHDAHVFHNGRTTRRVNVKEVAIYIMAPYGFDDFEQDVPYLGHFNKKHFALVTDGEWVNAPVYTGKDAHARNALMRPVSKPLYIQWRQKHNKGGDMLLFSERRPSFPDIDVVVPHEPSPTGTLYWGGAGLDGPYIQPTLRALQNAGISNVYVGMTNSAGYPDNKVVGTFVDAIRAGLSVRYEDDGEWRLTSGMNAGEGQFNLIGYSYGSLLAAQTANYYARQGFIVDHLVLVASPIDDDFLTRLKKSPNIKQVTVINLTSEGDQIYAGIPQWQLMNPLFIEKLGSDMLSGRGEGHFYYGHPVPALNARLKTLAEYIASKGLR